MDLQPALATDVMPRILPTPRSARRALRGPLQRVVLTGFMGSGKSTVGRLLAAELGWTFVDLDTIIEQRTGEAVPHIFATRGEAAFRREETAALAATLRLSQCVIALGGGAPESLANRLLLEQTPRTHIVYLAAPFATLAGRCNAAATDPGQTLRPNFADPELARQRFQTRLPLYRRLAHAEVTTEGRTPQETAADVRSTLATDATKP